MFKRLNGMVIILLLYACSSPVTPTAELNTLTPPHPLTSDTPLITFPTPSIPAATNTPLIPKVSPVPDPTATATSTNTPEPANETELGFELPPECSILDPSLGYWYADMSHGACDNPALSLDGAYIAYGYVAKNKADDSSDQPTIEARLFSTALLESYLIHIPKCHFIHPVWTPSGYLVIEERAQDVGCEQTVVYDVAKNEIVATINGAVWSQNSWSPDRNAFFTINPIDFGPVCAETLSGFDLIAGKTISTIKPITPGTNIYKVINLPIWSHDSKSLFAVIRDGICSNEEKYECTYNNAYIVVINLDGTQPTISHPYYDPTMDYSVRRLENGTMEINAAPTKTVNCWDISKEERR